MEEGLLPGGPLGWGRGRRWVAAVVVQGILVGERRGRAIRGLKWPWDKGKRAKAERERGAGGKGCLV